MRGIEEEEAETDRPDGWGKAAAAAGDIQRSGRKGGARGAKGRARPSSRRCESLGAGWKPAKIQGSLSRTSARRHSKRSPGRSSFEEHRM